MPPSATACLSCACCAGWTVALATLRDQIRLHQAGELRLDSCPVEGCLICKDADWQAEIGARPAVADVALEEPCQSCSCCRVWIPNLEIVRGHAKGHVNSEIRAGVCRWGDCIVCEEWDG